jgi:hypothetical protein
MIGVTRRNGDAPDGPIRAPELTSLTVAALPTMVLSEAPSLWLSWVATSSRGGKTIILKVAEAGELLGPPSTWSAKGYQVTAEVSERAGINFIPRVAVLRFLCANPEAFIQVTQLLTENHMLGISLIQSLGLSLRLSQKLAQFLLGWSADHAQGQGRYVQHL